MIETIHESLRSVEGVEANSYNIRPYTLFGEKVPDYFTATRDNESTARYLAYCHSSAPDACLWPLSPENRPPGHGMMIAYNLPTLRPKSAIDLGCGALLFLGRLVRYLGAEQVVGVDITPQAENSNMLARDGLTYIQANMFNDSFADTLPLSRFDLAITHPPMMPAPEGVSQTDHDFAGPTGREVLDSIIERAPSLLNPGGRLVIGQFDFLGLEHATGDPACTADKLAEAGMTIDEIHTYRVPASRAIEDNLEEISTTYPNYTFEETDTRLYHRFSVVNALLNSRSNQ